MECSTAWVAYGLMPEEAETSESTVEHRRAVADVFGQMAEIEIIALEKQLKTSQDGSVYLLHPTTNIPVPIGLSDIERRKEQWRNAYRPPPVTPTASRTGSISSCYCDIDGYNQVFQAQTLQADAQSNRRRCLIAAAVAFLYFLVVTVVFVVVLLVTGPIDKKEVICGDLESSCADGQICIPSSERCDGNNDCGDSSDERNCAIPTTTLTTTATPAPTTSPTPTTTTTPTAALHRCILLIGGAGSGELVEYYHPTIDECDMDAIGMISTEKINNTRDTSGCYLSNTQQIAIREGFIKLPMLYGLRDSSAKELPPPPIGHGHTIYSTAAALSPTRCLSCGAYDGNSWFKECYQFDSCSPTNWTSIPSLPLPITHSASVSMGNDNSFYVVGGLDESNGFVSPSKQLYRYSVGQRQWYSETPMNHTRYWHSAAALSATEFIVCGGEMMMNHWQSRNDCEVYNTTEKKWRPVGDLTIGRHDFAMRSFNGTVYAIGGEGEGVELDSVEEYNVKTEKWMEVKKLKHSRKSFVAVVV